MSSLKKWMGFQGDSIATGPANQKSISDQSVSSGEKIQPIERIRELESELAELRSRRDITALSKEEFEILATETAMTLIRTAQQREAKAEAMAKRAIADGQRTSKELLESAEVKARTTINQAEVRGRRLIQAAEADAKDFLVDAQRESEELIASKRREASSILASAKREAEEKVSIAITEMNEYRSWLSEVLSEAQRLYKLQIQSLDSANNAIEQSRSKLDGAMDKLNALNSKVEEVFQVSGKPVVKKSSASSDESEVGAKVAKDSPQKKSVSVKPKSGNSRVKKRSKKR